MAVRPPIPVGAVLNETYRLERLIARGGMGAVYEAAHLRLTRRFAVKVLTGSLTRHPELMGRFQREAEIIGAIGHPHIVDAVDFNQTAEGAPYMVMELLDGETLGARLLRQGPLPIVAAAHIFMQAASALEAAHAKGIVHRDLKPQNIFLCKRGRQDDFVKIFDFGISKVEHALTQLTRADTVMGTVFYMSPEQVRGDRDLDRRSDVYAMGSILHEMLSGSVPFNAELTLEIFRSVLHTPPPRLSKIRSGIPPPIEGVVLRSLAKKREERFNSMLDFWVALAAALRSSGLEVPESVEERRSLWPSREDTTHVEHHEPTESLPAPLLADEDQDLEEDEPGPPEATTRMERPSGLPLVAEDSEVMPPAEGRVSSVPLDTSDILPDELASKPTLALHSSDLFDVKPSTRTTGQLPRRRGALYALLAVGVVGAGGGLVAGLLLWSSPAAVHLTADAAPLVATPPRPDARVLSPAAPRPDTRAALAVPAALEAGPSPDSEPRHERVKLRVPPRPAATGPGTLAIQASSAGRPVLPDIFVDGARRGQPPLVLKLPAGLHTVEARLQGHRPVTRQVRVIPRAERSVVLELKPR